MSESEITIDKLKDPSIYKEDVKSPEIIQTHISYVVLTGEHAYKIKKPVDFGFLDFSTLEKRKKFCNEELILNKRLCPQIYLDVVAVRKNGECLKIDGDKGEVVDYAVKMNQFSQRNIMKNKLQKGEIRWEEIEDICDILVDFYRTEETSDEIKKYGEICTVKHNTDENFEQTKDIIDDVISRESYGFIKKITNDFLKEKNVFEKRIQNGFILDCHGDLHSGNIVFLKGKKVCIFDCIEFNKRFRYGDVASDIGFLAMDLDFQGFPYLSSYLVEKYVEKSEDKQIVDVLNFYKCYRAYVRGKVASFQLNDKNIEEKEKNKISNTSSKYFDLSYYYAKLIDKTQLQSDRNILFITAGLTGTGKTTVARKLSIDYGAEKISTDEVRKETRGIEKYERHFEEYDKGIYSPEKKYETYMKVLERGRQKLKEDQNVVLDATFKNREMRDKAKKIADENNADFLIINTVCPEEKVKQFLQQRIQKKSISDGRWEVYEKQKNLFDYPSKDEKFVKINITKNDLDYQLNAYNKILEKI
ncbi:MAG: AAA family ATPase [Candidatus Thermoplasmatota archaeon]